MVYQTSNHHISCEQRPFHNFGIVDCKEIGISDWHRDFCDWCMLQK